VAIRVRLIGDLRRFVESEIVEIESGGCTLGAALHELARLHPRLGRELFDDQGRLHYAVVLMTSGRRALWPEDSERLVENGGELLLTRFHTGG